MSAVKSMSTPSTGSSFLRSRLCMAVANTSKKSLELITTVAAASGPNFLLLVHIAASRELFTGLVYMYLAEMNLEKKEMGLTLGYCTTGKVRSQLVSSLLPYLLGIFFLSLFLFLHARNF